MNDVRARFEEIWPVPFGVCWCIVDGGYFAESTEHIPNSIRHNARLDTFTRCQETTDVYVSLIEDLVRELENASPWIHDSSQYCFAADAVDRAKQILGREK